MYDKYLELKEAHNDSLVMIKAGNFYHTYDEDSIIMNYLFKYKIKDNKVGFLIKSLDKVINKLLKYNINYFMDDDNFKLLDNNSYLVSNIERKYIKIIINKIKDVID